MNAIIKPPEDKLSRAITRAEWLVIPMESIVPLRHATNRAMITTLKAVAKTFKMPSNSFVKIYKARLRREGSNLTEASLKFTNKDVLTDRQFNEQQIDMIENVLKKFEQKFEKLRWQYIEQHGKSARKSISVAKKAGKKIAIISILSKDVTKSALESLSNVSKKRKCHIEHLQHLFEDAIYLSADGISDAINCSNAFAIKKAIDIKKTVYVTSENSGLLLPNSIRNTIIVKGDRQCRQPILLQEEKGHRRWNVINFTDLLPFVASSGRRNKLNQYEDNVLFAEDVHQPDTGTRSQRRIRFNTNAKLYLV